MAKVTDELMGGFTGKVGNLLFYKVNGQTLVRTKPGASSGKITPLQTFHQKSFGLVQYFMSPIKKELAIGYAAYAKGAKRGIDRAKSLMLKNAIYPLDGEPVLLPERALVSSGELTRAKGALLSVLEAGKFRIDWEPNSWDGSARDSDKTFVVVYDTVARRVFSLQGNKYRKDGSLEVTLPWLLVTPVADASKVFVYFSFYSERSGKIAFSDSVCLGEI
ncbi:DUF6266 family protein [Algoriphagus antarcticus]|uniref:Uncharacterized protein n=1 Tax=Algoriphagus antarcticus TaxID=238540 RepID=A0A3E0D4B9_9BACT|nr:DUF6266 family protein [Algoriphagus antarcticus]REG77520.1 hypothetical protein C8N25_14320 [Algoriphagus antarcticus]